MNDFLSMFLRHFPGLFLGLLPLWSPRLVTIFAPHKSDQNDIDRQDFIERMDYMMVTQSWVITPIAMAASILATENLYSLWGSCLFILGLCGWIAVLVMTIKQGAEGIHRSRKILRVAWRLLPLVMILLKIMIDEQLILAPPASSGAP